jgi:hypothetical protein
MITDLCEPINCGPSSHWDASGGTCACDYGTHLNARGDGCEVPPQLPSQHCACAAVSFGADGATSHRGCGKGSTDPCAPLGYLADQNWCQTEDSSCRGAIGNGFDFCTPEGQGASCIYANDGTCDEGTYCDAGTDAEDCGGATSIPSGGCMCAPATHGPNGEIWFYGCGRGTGQLVEQFGWNGYEDRDWCETADPTCQGAFADPSFGSLAQLGSDYCDQSQVDGDTSESCQYSNDGACDEGTYCDIGTDSTDCAGGCLTFTLDAVNAACPASGRDLVPSTCNGVCAAAFVPWWARCFSEDSVHFLDSSNAGQLSAFNLLCGGTAMGSGADTFQSPQFSVVSGPCTVEEGGRCVGRPAGYSDSETCQISSSKTARLEACPIFNTERGCEAANHVLCCQLAQMICSALPLLESSRTNVWLFRCTDDHLRIDGANFEGTSCPEGVSIAEGSEISWTSDGSVAGDGWEICASSGGKVQQGPPPPAAFTVISGPCTLEMDGTCVGRPAGYSNSETCEIASTGSAFLQACPVFSTESGCKSQQSHHPTAACSHKRRKH